MGAVITKKPSDDLVSPRIFASLESLNAKDGAPNLGLAGSVGIDNCGTVSHPSRFDS